jgi:hypothetical protein
MQFIRNALPVAQIFYEILRTQKSTEYLWSQKLKSLNDDNRKSV